MLPSSQGWRRLLLRPGERPLDELRRVLVSGAADPLAEALEALPPDTRLLIAVDQLEELFTQCRAADERAAFVDALTRAAADRAGRAVVVVALRADFYGRLAAYPALAELLGSSQVLVGPMHASELRRAVVLPAARVGLRIEPALVDALVDDVEGEPGALPLLSAALLELWQKRRDDLLTLASYRESGGVLGAVARLAESTYARIPPERAAIVRVLMLRLVGEGEREAPVRRRAPLAEFDLERNQDLTAVLETLADSRLITVSEGSVEVAHEALLREWPRLREWIDADAEGRRLRRHITVAAAEWDASGRETGELYRGARLAAALDWSTDHALELNELERSFVTESREASERDSRRARRTNRRLRALLAGVAVLLAAAVAGGIFAAVQRGEARSAATAQLAQRLGAQALVEEDLDLSLLLARQAVAVDDSPQTRGYLLSALQRFPAVLGVMHGGNALDVMRGIAVSPDGSTLAVVAPETGLLFFDARTYRRIGEPVRVAITPPVPFRTEIEAVAYSPDGGTVVISGNGYIRSIDARTHKRIAEVRSDDGANRIVFSGDGSRVVTVESSGGPAWVTIRDASTLEPVGPPITPTGFMGLFISQWWADPNIALTPDGRSLITASTDGELAWWDLDSRKQTRSLAIEPGYRALALSPDGRTAAVGFDQGIRLVDLRTGTVREATGPLPSFPTWLLFSPDGETVVSTSRDGSVVLWDVRSAAPRESLVGHSREVQQPAFSPDGKTLYTVSHDGTAIAWDLRRDRRRGLARQFRFTDDGPFDQTYDWHPGRFSPDGRSIAVGLREHGVALWDVRSLTPVGVLPDTGSEVKAVAFSPDGRTLAAMGVDGTATVWDVRSRARLRSFHAGRTSLGVSFSADGKTIATAGYSGVDLWDAATGDWLDNIGDGVFEAGDVAFSPTGQLLAFVREAEANAEIWNGSSRSRVRTVRVEVEDPDYLLGWSVAFSRDGRMLATPGHRGRVHVWDVGTGRLVRELEHNEGTAVLAVEFSPDSRTLALSGSEAFASLWDLATGAQIGPRLTAGRRGAMIDVSPDGRRLLETHGNGEGAVWDIDPESWKRRACLLANRRLTRAEWEKYLPGRSYAPACAA
jgi:WD40 repeat protein